MMGTARLPLAPQSVNHGDTTAITAALTADPMRYFFKGWTVTSGSNVSFEDSAAESTTVTLTGGNATVKANFDKYGLYWTDFDLSTVFRSTSDFSSMAAIAGTPSEASGIDIDIANEHVYYSDYSGNIWRSDLDGGNPNIIYTIGTHPWNYALALDLVNIPNKLYAVNYSGGILRMNLDGSGVETVVGGPGYRGVAVDGAGGFVYIAYLIGIYRSNIATGQLFYLLPAPGGAFEIDLDLTNNKMYWVEYNFGTCKRANLDGSGPETLIGGGLNLPRGITLDVDSNRMYITSQGSNLIYECDLDGNLISPFPGTGAPSGIAIDTDP